jgi:hypothetical protein
MKAVEEKAAPGNELHGVDPRRRIHGRNPRQQLGGIGSHITNGRDALGQEIPQIE